MTVDRMTGVEDHDLRGFQRARRSGENWVTPTEATILVFVIAILAVVVTQRVFNSIEGARPVECMAEVRGNQAAIIMDADPPVVVGGEGGAADPKYTLFIRYEFGGLRGARR